LIGLPIVQLLIFGFAITTEVRNANVAILDNSKDEVTQSIITKIESSQYFDIDRSITSNYQIEKAFKSDKNKTGNRYQVIILQKGRYSFLTNILFLIGIFFNLCLNSYFNKKDKSLRTDYL